MKKGKPRTFPLRKDTSSDKKIRGKILKLKLGYNPNSSSIGAYIGIFLWSVVIAVTIINTIASIIVLRFSKSQFKSAGDKNEK